MENEIFNQEEFSHLSAQEQETSLKKIHQLFQFRRSYYHQIRNSCPDIDLLSDINDVVTPFEEWFGPWNQELSTFVKRLEINSCVGKFNQANVEYGKVEARLNELIPGGIILGANVNNALDPAIAKFNEKSEQLINNAQERLAKLENELLTTISNGIDDVLKLKQELHITSSLQDRIGTEIKNAPSKAKDYMTYFISTLIIFMGLIIGSLFISTLNEMPWYASLSIRLSVALPIIWIAHTLYLNYRYYKVAELKFEHLHRLLGGGATTISKMLEDDEYAKATTYRRLSDLFLDIDDLTSIYSTKTNPSETSMEISTDLLKQIKELIKEVKDLQETKGVSAEIPR